MLECTQLHTRLTRSRTLVSLEQAHTAAGALGRLGGRWRSRIREHLREHWKGGEEGRRRRQLGNTDTGPGTGQATWEDSSYCVYTQYSSS